MRIIEPSSPKFYQDVETGLYHYLKEMGFHENPENLKHQIYTVFSHWEIYCLNY